MKLLSLHLSNVRNYAHEELEPADGLNVFVGRNAQGKSNLLEAISLLGTGKSFRTSTERDVIRDGFDVATITGQARVRAGTIRLGCTLTAGPRGTRKMYAVNGHAVRYASYLGSVRVVTFVPSDLHLAAGPPAGRRAFLNSALAQAERAYYHELARYQKALTQKAALLKSDAGFDQQLLDVYNASLVESGTQIMLARHAFIAQLSVSAASAHRRWSGSETLAVRYRPNVPFEVGTADAIAGALGNRLVELAGAERVRRTCLAGPHRDDLELLLDGLALAAYGSQGQQRTAVLALKVGEYTVMRDHSGEAPLLLLDDVLSELDSGRARSFLEGIGDFEQSFVTATHVPEGLPPARLYSIEQARVTQFSSGEKSRT